MILCYSLVGKRPYGPVVQLVRTLACHARGRRFESVPGRHAHAAMAQMAEHILGKDEVTSSNLVSSSTARFAPYRGPLAQLVRATGS